MRTRKTGPDDIPALKALWKQAFGDTDAEIDSFFQTVYPEATGFCAEEDGAVIAMLFALPLTLAHGEEMQKAAYLYAVATDEAFRGRGVCPEPDGVRRKDAAETLRLPVCCSFRRRKSLRPTMRRWATRGRTAAPRRRSARTRRRARRLWSRRRNTRACARRCCLTCRTRAIPRRQLDYAAEDLDFYRLEQGYALGCAAVRRAGQIVEELLPDARMLPALAAALGAGQYPVKTPGHGTMNCMAKWLDAEKQTAPIWLAFDFD